MAEAHAAAADLDSGATLTYEHVLDAMAGRAEQREIRSSGVAHPFIEWVLVVHIEKRPLPER